MKMKYCYSAIIEKDGEGYTVWFPDLKGCITCGGTILQALEHAKEALGVYLEVLHDEGDPIPEPSQPENLEIENGQFIAIIEFDWLEYQNKYCPQKSTVKRSVKPLEAAFDRSENYGK
jgi:predicted RNase H-like HicB family nuclease